MKKLKRILDGLTAAYVTILAMLVLPPMAGFQVYGVISGSMSPAIPTGAAVYVKMEDFSRIREGDVITYSLKNGACVTHRVEEKKEKSRSFVTRGDANPVRDGAEVSYEDLRGVVRFHIPLLGYGAALLTDMGAKMLLAGILLWLFLVKAIMGSMIRMKEAQAICR